MQHALESFSSPDSDSKLHVQKCSAVKGTHGARARLVTAALILTTCVLCRRLGFPVDSSSQYYDSSKPINATAFLQWIKRHIIAGRPVAVALRLQNYTDDTYDHIVPFFGVCSTNTNATAPLLRADGFSFSTDFSDEVYRTANTPGMFAKRYVSGGCSDVGMPSPKHQGVVCVY